MKTFLLITGIVVMIACVLSLLFAALNLFGYYRVLDGSPELYRDLQRRAIVFAALGLGLAAVGAACLIVRAKL